MSTKKDSKIKRNGDLRDLNEVHHRIKFCRKHLRLTMKEICMATGIPLASYAGREYGTRSIYHEEYLALAQYFNQKWRPGIYKNQEINKITAAWLMFGVFEE